MATTAAAKKPAAKKPAAAKAATPKAALPAGIATGRVAQVIGCAVVASLFGAACSPYLVATVSASVPLGSSRLSMSPSRLCPLSRMVDTPRC